MGASSRKCFFRLEGYSNKPNVYQWSRSMWDEVLLFFVPFRSQFFKRSLFSGERQWPFWPLVNLLTPHRERSFSGHGQYICEVSLLYGKNKWSYHVETIQSLKTKYDLVLWSFDSKINRGPFQVEVYISVKYHYCMPKLNGAVVRKC